MSTRKYVRPREGMHIRDPFTMLPIPPEGAEVVMDANTSTVILRQLRDGDLVECDPPAELPAVFSEPPAALPEVPAELQNALREIVPAQAPAETVEATEAHVDAPAEDEVKS